MPCSCTVVTQSGVSGISYTLDPDLYVVDLFVDNQCQGPSFASFDQSMTVQCFTGNQIFPSGDAVSLLSPIELPERLPVQPVSSMSSYMLQ